MWAQVLRQWAVAAGHGPRRPKPKKTAKPKLGTEGEDTTMDAAGKLLLRLPPRFGPHTVKGAAWQARSQPWLHALALQLGDTARLPALGCCSWAWLLQQEPLHCVLPAVWAIFLKAQLAASMLFCMSACQQL